MNNGFKGGFGGGGGFGNIQQLMKQAQKMQEDIGKIKEEIEASEFSAKAGGGMVEVILMGNRTLKSVKIKPEVVDPNDVEMLEDLLVAAINDGLSQIEKIEKERLPNLPM